MEEVRNILIDEIKEKGIVDNLIIRDYYQDKFQAALDEVKEVEKAIYIGSSMVLINHADQTRGMLCMYINGAFRDIYVTITPMGWYDHHGNVLEDFKL